MSGTPRPYAPAMLGERAAAAYCDLSVTTLRALREAGQAPPRVIVGGRKLYRRADLDAWVLSLPTEDIEPADQDEWA